MRARHKPLASALPILAAAGSKGGTGKSTLMRCIAHNLTTWKIPWVGFDCDGENSHFARYYGGVAAIQILPVTSADQFGTLLDLIEGVDPSRAVLIDMPAGAGKFMEHRGGRLKALAEHLGRPLLRQFSINDGVDVYMALQRELPQLGLDNVIAALNGGFGPLDSFQLWRTRPLTGELSWRDQVLGAGGREIYVPRIPEAALAAMEIAWHPFHETSAITSSMTFNQRFDYLEWLSEMEAAYSSLRELF